jgi:hypothetical protein
MAHETEHKMNEAYEDSKKEWKELSADMSAFISEFAHDFRSQGFKFAPERAKGICHHSIGYTFYVAPH